jgi:hypothetical protein
MNKNIRPVLAIIIILWCFISLTYIKLTNSVQSAYSGFIGVVLGYYFVSSHKGTNE